MKDWVLMAIYFAVVLITGQTTARLRAQEREEHRRQERATALYQFTRALTEAKTLLDAATAASQQIDGLFGCASTVAFVEESQPHGAMSFHGSLAMDEREKAAAMRALFYRAPSGRFTTSDSNCAGFFTPMVRYEHAYGVIGVKLSPKADLSADQRELLNAFADQFALVVERAHLHAAAEREKFHAESEKLYHALMESVSHELRTPLSVITATSEVLTEAQVPGYGVQVSEIHQAGKRLSRLVANLLDQTRLESGALRPHMDWCDPQDLANAAAESAHDAMAGRALTVAIPEDMPFVRADFALTEQALVNLLLNAAVHTPAGKPIALTAGIEPGGHRAFFTVADCGPGIAPAVRDELFNKFSRGSAAPPGGLGLGLSIVRGFITTQGGDVEIGDNPGGGAKITLYLPHTKPENPPPE